MAKPLDDKTIRQDLVTAIEGGATLFDACATLSANRGLERPLTPRTVQRYAERTHNPGDSRPSFRDELATARIRRTQLDHHTHVNPSPALDPRPDPMAEFKRPPASTVVLWDKQAYLERVQAVADDDEHPACAKAWTILGAWHLDAPMVVARKKAEIEAQAEADHADLDGGFQVERVRARLPEKIFEDKDAIDAEIIEDA